MSEEFDRLSGMTIAVVFIVTKMFSSHGVNKYQSHAVDNCFFKFKNFFQHT